MRATGLVPRTPRISSSAPQVALPEPAAVVVAGGFASYALAASRKLYAWGSNAQGQKGVGAWGWSGHKPEVVDHISDGRIAAVRALYCAMPSDADLLNCTNGLVSCARTLRAQLCLSLGVRQCRWVFCTAAQYAPCGQRRVSLTHAHAVCRAPNTIGRHKLEQWTQRMYYVPHRDGSVQVAAGGFHAAALTHEGEVYTWGSGRYGVLGHGGGSGASVASPKRVAALRGVNVVKVRCCCGLHLSSEES